MDKEKQAKKLLTLHEEPILAIFDAIGEVNDNLKTLIEKEMPEIPPFPEIYEPLEEVSVKNFPLIQQVEVINFPEQKEMETYDMTETNRLLQSLLDKEDKEVNISVTLKIE